MTDTIQTKKHIDVITKFFVPVAAGIETNILETYSILAEMGWDVTIHTLKDTYLEKNILAEQETLRGLDIRRYPFRMLGYKARIDLNHTDVVALHNFDIFPHVWILLRTWLRKLRGNKHYALIVTPHGGFNPEWPLFSPIQRFIKRTYHMTLGVWLINHAVDAVRAVSEWEKEQMILSGVRSELVSVISNGIEDEAYADVDNKASQDIKQKVESWGSYLIQIGRIYPIKNYETTIRALARLPGDISYVIAGPMADENYRRYLDSLIQELHLEGRVHFAGVIRGVDKYYMIKHAQMMVHMAVWESFCNVVHEGMSQGLVCIVANQTALPYLVKDGINGYCVAVRDDTTLAQSIWFVLDHTNGPSIKVMRECNRAYGLAHSWRGVAEQMDQLYQKMLHLPPQDIMSRVTEARYSKVSITVGVPAHNEEANIKYLIENIMAQRGNFMLEKVIIACDACTDKTEENVHAMQNMYPNIIECWNDGKHLGKSLRLNQIFASANTDIIVTFDADIKCNSDEVIAELVKPMLNSSDVVLVSGRSEPTKPVSFVQKVAYTGFKIWDDLRNSVIGADMYFFEGSVRAFREILYKEIKFPRASADDAYPYLYCMQKGYKMAFAPRAIIKYTAPTSYVDYLKQISRILRSEDVHTNNFDSHFTNKFYVIKTRHKLKMLAHYLILNPFWTSMYLLFLILPKINYRLRRNKIDDGKWAVATSTKKSH